MNLAEVMTLIEDHRFSAKVNIAAGTTAFRRGLRNHDLVLQLTNLAKKAAARAEIAKRIAELSCRETNPRYENIYDAALSGYLIALEDTAEPDVVAEAAAAVSKSKNCWWAASLSRELLTKALASGGVAVSISHHFVPAALLKTLKASPAQAYSVEIGHWVEAMKKTGNLESGPRLLSLVTLPTGRSETAVSGNADESLVRPGARRRIRGRGPLFAQKHIPGRHGISPRAHAH